jgi:hypothetical protein
MDSVALYTQKKPTVMKRRGGTNSNPANARPDLDEDTRIFEQGMAETKLRETTETRATITQEFEFVNATDPYSNKDLKIRKLIRSHVVDDGVQKRKQLQEQKSKRALKQPDCSKESKKKNCWGCTIFNARFECIFWFHVSGIRERDDSQPRPESAVSPYSSTRLFHSASLDPYPQLSPIIFYVAPWKTSLDLTPSTPVNWFDSALSDDALFHALLYTTSTYAGLISGTTESQESIMHVGRSLKLGNDRLKGLRPPRQELEVSEETIGAVSCLAISEVGLGICFEIRRLELTDIG